MDNLYQLHWQFEDGKTEMRAQNTINSTAEMKAWEKDVCERHPLPKGAKWLLCNDKSIHFAMTVATVAEDIPVGAEGLNIEAISHPQ